MPNRSELAPVTGTKAAAGKSAPLLHGNINPAEHDEIHGLLLVAGLCVIGALISIDFAAYFQVLDKLPMLAGQVP